MRRILIISLIILFSFVQSINAAQGNNAYDLGISTGELLVQLGENEKKATKEIYEYSEVVFLTGKPLVFTGLVTINRGKPSNLETISYNFDLSNGANKLTRTISYDIRKNEQNNQVQRVWSVKSNAKPNETITIDSVAYRLQSSQDFSLSTITDRRPAVDYYTGDYVTRKVYKSEDRTITVNTSGSLWGYDQFWGSAETQLLKVVVTGETVRNNIVDKWGGAGEVRISSVSAKKLLYRENLPDEISFAGGYLQRQENNSTLFYSFEAPEFDYEGFATNRLTLKEDSITLQSFPQQVRLLIPDTTQIRGNWYEQDVSELFSLGIYDSDGHLSYTEFEDPITRVEFAKMIVRAANMPMSIMPKPIKGAKKGEVVDPSPFADLLTTDEDFLYALTLYEKNVMLGVGDGLFEPEAPVSRAQAVTIFTRILGLESLASSPGASTPFTDNDLIPSWARPAVLVTRYIGVTKGDDQMRFNPLKNLSKGETATFLNRLINYMREDMVKDYRERIMNY